MRYSLRISVQASAIGQMLMADQLSVFRVEDLALS